MQKIAMFSVTDNGKCFREMMVLAKQLGFSGMELLNHDDLSTPDLSVASALRDQAAELEMDLCCLSVGVDLMADPADGAVARLKDYVAVAKTAGAPYIHFTTFPVLSYDRRGICMNAMIQRLAPRVREVCDYAAEQGIGCVLEGQGFYMNGIEPLAGLVEAVDHPNMGIVADIGNVLCVDVSPERFVGYFAPLIHHVHIKDMVCSDTRDDTPGVSWAPSRGGRWLYRTELGTGCVNIKQCLRILAAAGYDGYYSIENTVLDRLDKVIPDREYLDRLLTNL